MLILSFLIALWIFEVNLVFVISLMVHFMEHLGNFLVICVVRINFADKIELMEMVANTQLLCSYHFFFNVGQ